MNQILQTRGCKLIYISYIAWYFQVVHEPVGLVGTILGEYFS